VEGAFRGGYSIFKYLTDNCLSATAIIVLQEMSKQSDYSEKSVYLPYNKDFLPYEEMDA
jgi:hypothetical protein